MSLNRKLVLGNPLRLPNLASDNARAAPFIVVYIPERRAHNRLGRVAWRAYQYG